MWRSWSFLLFLVVLHCSLSCEGRLWAPQRVVLSRRPSPKALTRLAVRGGGVATDGEQPLSVQISTSLGSSFLDKKKKFTMSRNETVLALKQQIANKFPGLPPTALQRLFFAGRRLADDEQLGSVLGESPLQTLPLLLDMVTGTAAYNKTMSVTQAIEAYVSTVVHLSYLGNTMRSVLITAGDNTGDSATVEPNAVHPAETAVPDTLQYRALFEAVNASLYAQYAEDIAAALEAERNPEYSSQDTQAWREKERDRPQNPLTVALAKELDLNRQGLFNFVFYSFILMVFAAMSGKGESSQGLLLLIPLMWISKLRQLRIIFKIVVNILLQVLPTMDFLLPLFPATYQVIALEQEHWFDVDDCVHNQDIEPEEQGEEETSEDTLDGDEIDDERAQDEYQSDEDLDDDSNQDE